MQLSIGSDYISSRGNPFPELARISNHGFSHIQWIHQWSTDFLYTKPEIDEIEKQLGKLSLKLNEVHASKGVEKEWMAPEEYRRKAGVELIKNRIDFTKRLGGDCIVLHHFEKLDQDLYEIQLKQGLKSLHELKNYSVSSGVKIALENLLLQCTFDVIEDYFNQFSPDFLGFCWDTGHSNLSGPEVTKRVEEIARERLCAIHLNDNEANGKDQHLIPFDGTCNWEWITDVIKNSPYKKNKPLTMELSSSSYNDVDQFLAKAKKIGEKLTQMVA
jgi:sugar phosphate isomerase/epimerase